jgi:hypothetical protein
MQPVRVLVVVVFSNKVVQQQGISSSSADLSGKEPFLRRSTGQCPGCSIVFVQACCNAAVAAYSWSDEYGNHDGVIEKVAPHPIKFTSRSELNFYKQCPGGFI